MSTQEKRPLNEEEDGEIVEKPKKRQKKESKPLPPGIAPLVFPEGASQEKRRKLQSEHDKKVAKLRRQLQREENAPRQKTTKEKLEARKESRINVLCKYYQKGNCIRGDDCEFSHDLNKIPCKYHHWFQACKLGDTCPYSHDALTEEETEKMLQEMQASLGKNPCKFHHVFGKCETEACPFSHDPLEQGTIAWRIIQEQKAMVQKSELK